MANPFSQSNPFDSGSGGGSTANPFADPSVTTASKGNGGGMDTSPFSSAPPVAPPEVSVSNFQKPHFQADFGAPTAAKSSFGQSDVELRNKERELAQREQEILQRERALADQLSSSQHANVPGAGLVNNWPKCAPVLHMDIQGSVPAGKKWIVWQMYFHWFLIMAVVACNVVGIITYLSSGGTSDPTTIAAEVMMCLCYLILVPPVAFVIWYYPFYVACKSNGAMRFMPLFVTFGIHILWLVVMLLGIPSTGMAGLIKAIVLFVDGATAGGVILMCIMVVYFVALVHAIMIYVKIVQLYKSAGGRSAAKLEAANAANQAKSAAMPYVTDIAGKYAAEGAKSYAQNKFGSGSGANRV